MPSETANRKSLPGVPALLAMTIAEKKTAGEQGLRTILQAIRTGDIVLGDWERISIHNVLLMLGCGLYTVALSELACAICPAADRSPHLKVSARTAARTLEDFERELERVSGCA